MSMDTHAMDSPMTPEDAFCVTLLVTCEITKNILLGRLSSNKKIREKQMYYLERMNKDIEGLNATYPGYLPDNFQNSAERYHRNIEIDMQSLLKHYKGED